MRIRWNETYIEEVKDFSFVPWLNANDSDNWGVAVEIDNEYQAYLNREKFSSLKEAEKWAEKQCGEIMVKGYWDVTKVKDYVDLVQ